MSPRAPSYQAESLRILWNELAPLAAAHWTEIHGDAGAFRPDRARYAAVESAGFLRVFTARDWAWGLLGYAAYIVAPDLHDATRLTATADGLFVLPTHRPLGVGIGLLRHAIAALRAERVTSIEQQVSVACDFSPVLRRLGFAESFTTYSLPLEPPCPPPPSPLAPSP